MVVHQVQVANLVLVATVFGLVCYMYGVIETTWVLPVVLCATVRCPTRLSRRFSNDLHEFNVKCDYINHPASHWYVQFAAMEATHNEIAHPKLA